MSPSPPEYQQNAPVPPGNVPKNRQTWIMLAVAAAIVLAVLFSGSGTPAPKTNGASPGPSPIAPPSKQEIVRYTESLAQDEQRLRAAQESARRAEEAYRALGQPAQQGSIPGQNAPLPAGSSYYPADPAVQQKTALEQEREKREYASVFASNIALSYRRPLAESLREAEREEKGSSPSVAAPAAVPPVVSEEVRRRHVLLEGTIIEAVLTNRLEGAFSGPVNVMLTTDIWSHNRQHLLIPRGSRFLGEAKRVTDQDQERLAIVFHRLVMPDGFSVKLEDETPGLDQAGATGVKDKVNHHYLSKFGTAAALGLLAGFSMYNTRGVYTGDASDYYRQGVGQSLSMSGQQILGRALNRLPDITIREGTRMRILLAADLPLPAYDEHPPAAGL